MAAQRFNSHVVGLHSLTTEYAVVFGGEMGFSISSEVDRTLEREGHERRDQARRLFRDFMNANGVPLDPMPVGHNGPSASWREEDGRQNAVVWMIGRVFDLILVEQPEKLASIAEATLEDALFESGRPVLMVPKRSLPTLGEVVAIAWNGGAKVTNPGGGQRTYEFTVDDLHRGINTLAIHAPVGSRIGAISLVAAAPED